MLYIIGDFFSKHLFFPFWLFFPFLHLCLSSSCSQASVAKHSVGALHQGFTGRPPAGAHCQSTWMALWPYRDSEWLWGRATGGTISCHSCTNRTTTSTGSSGNSGIRPWASPWPPWFSSACPWATDRPRACAQHQRGICSRVGPSAGRYPHRCVVFGESAVRPLQPQ